MLFPYKKQGAVWGPLPWDSDQQPGLQAGQPWPPLIYSNPRSYTALHSLLASLAAFPACLVFPLETLVCLTT